jgi:NAD(P)-dependent dehydrogenase (short-subunit alcohol dehydrogenase family)
MRLKDRVALITGGTSGIGKATASLFLREGARVAIIGRDRVRGAQAVAEIDQTGDRTLFVPADVRSAEDCRLAVQATVQRFGRLDVLFNNAGVFLADTVVDCTEQDWDLQLDVNLKGAYLMSKYAIPVMIQGGGGAIVNNASGWGLVGGGEAAAYCASKGGVVLLTKAMAVDHSREGIRVNCVCPGDVETPMLPADAQRRGLSWHTYLAEAADRPMGRIGQPQEIASVVLFLASDEASFMTGAIVAVDGGGTAD